MDKNFLQKIRNLPNQPCQDISKIDVPQLHTCIVERLKKFFSQGLKRNRKISNQRTPFSSCDYLGLADHPVVVKAFIQSAKQHGVGATGSVFLGGYYAEHEVFEQQLAEYFQVERALLVSSGYMANFCVLTGLLQRGDIAFLDKACHRSLLEGVQLSRAKLKRYRHNDYQHLSLLLRENSSNNNWIITQTIFSMLGDQTNFDEITQIANVHQAHVIIDDAHGTGILDRAVLNHIFNLEVNPIFTASLSKALGCFGGVIAGSHDMIEAIVQFAAPYRLATALPPCFAAAASKSLQVLQNEIWRQEKLKKNIKDFQEIINELELPFFASNTPIQILPIGSVANALTLQTMLKKSGYEIAVIRPPTVAETQCIVRITLTVRENREQIYSLLIAIQECLGKLVFHVYS